MVAEWILSVLWD